MQIRIGYICRVFLKHGISKAIPCGSDSALIIVGYNLFFSRTICVCRGKGAIGYRNTLSQGVIGSIFLNGIDRCSDSVVIGKFEMIFVAVFYGDNG